MLSKFDDLILDNSKSGWNRVGAFDPKERSHALDVFGYAMQWILPTFSFHQVAHTSDMKFLEVGAKTLNKAMAGFCSHDDRLKAIGYLPLIRSCKSHGNNARRTRSRLLLFYDRYK